MDKRIIVRAIEDVTYFNFDETEILGEVVAGQEYEAELFEETEEYFTKDMFGREIYVAEINHEGKFILDNVFEIVHPDFYNEI